MQPGDVAVTGVEGPALVGDGRQRHSARGELGGGGGKGAFAFHPGRGLAAAIPCVMIHSVNRAVWWHFLGKPTAAARLPRRPTRVPRWFLRRSIPALCASGAQSPHGGGFRWFSLLPLGRRAHRGPAAMISGSKTACTADTIATLLLTMARLTPVHEAGVRLTSPRSTGRSWRVPSPRTWGLGSGRRFSRSGRAPRCWGEPEG